MSEIKQEALNAIDELLEAVQEMRESGETDIRSVIYAIEEAYSKVQSLKE